MTDQNQAERTCPSCNTTWPEDHGHCPRDEWDGQCWGCWSEDRPDDWEGWSTEEKQFKAEDFEVWQNETRAGC